MFAPVSSKPDLVAQEHEILALWRERRTFARLRAQNAGGPRWSFLDGPITANNPMGVHHAWGRTYKDLFQRFHAMLGEDQRWQNGFDCQGLWVEVNVEKDLGLHQQAGHRGVRHRRVREPVQAARADLRRAPDRAVDPARLLDGLERPRRAAPPARPAGRRPGRGSTLQGPRRAGHRHRGDARRAAGHARAGRLVLHVQQREQRPDLGLPRRVPPARLALQGPRHDALVRPLRDRDQPARDDRGLRGPRGPRPDGPLPARRPAGRGAARLDDDALDADLERGRGRRARTALRQGPPGRATVYWLGPRDAQARPSSGPFEVLEERPGRELVGWRYAGPFDDLPAVRAAFAAGRRRTGSPYEHRVVAWDEVGEEEGTGHRPHRPRLRRRGLRPRQGARAADDRPARRERGLHRRASASCPGATCATSPSRSSSALKHHGLLLPPGDDTSTATRTAGAAARRSSSGSSTSGTSAWARSTTSRASS